MPKKGHTEEQIIAALKQYEGGEKSADICRKLSISQATFYLWKKQYAGLGVQELRELRSWDENGRLKRLVADLSLTGGFCRRSSEKTIGRGLIRTPAGPETLLQVHWCVGRNGRLLFGVL